MVYGDLLLLLCPCWLWAANNRRNWDGWGSWRFACQEPHHHHLFYYLIIEIVSVGEDSPDLQPIARSLIAGVFSNVNDTQKFLKIT